MPTRRSVVTAVGGIVLGSGTYVALSSKQAKAEVSGLTVDDLNYVSEDGQITKLSLNVNIVYNYSVDQSLSRYDAILQVSRTDTDEWATVSSWGEDTPPQSKDSTITVAGDILSTDLWSSSDFAVATEGTVKP